MAKRKRKPPIHPALEARWNARVEELRQEFKEHVEGVSEDLKATHGWLIAAEGGIDEHRIFQCWVMQKLAMIQLAIEDLGDLSGPQRRSA
jgi:hypothetical protein